MQSSWGSVPNDAFTHDVPLVSMTWHAGHELTDAHLEPDWAFTQWVDWHSQSVWHVLPFGDGDDAPHAGTSHAAPDQHAAH